MLVLMSQSEYFHWKAFDYFQKSIKSCIYDQNLKLILTQLDFELFIEIFGSSYLLSFEKLPFENG